MCGAGWDEMLDESSPHSSSIHRRKCATARGNSTIHPLALIAVALLASMVPALVGEQARTRRPIVRFGRLTAGYARLPLPRDSPPSGRSRLWRPAAARDPITRDRRGDQLVERLRRANQEVGLHKRGLSPFMQVRPHVICVQTATASHSLCRKSAVSSRPW